MDYTDLATVKGALRIENVTDDTLLQRLITAASRTVDRLCGQSDRATDYFKSETVTDELLSAQVDVNGHLIAWPHKSIITSACAMSYQLSPLQSWQTVDPTLLRTDGHDITAWTYLMRQRSKVLVKVTYVGGHSGSWSTLPADLVEATTVMVGRFYREAETGLTDAIGVAELGTLTYTKSWPTRVREMLYPYTRRMPW